MVTAGLDALAPDTDGQGLRPAQGAVDHLQPGKGKEERAWWAQGQPVAGVGGRRQVTLVLIWV